MNLFLRPPAQGSTVLGEQTIGFGVVLCDEIHNGATEVMQSGQWGAGEQLQFRRASPTIDLEASDLGRGNIRTFR